MLLRASPRHAAKRPKRPAHAPSHNAMRRCGGGRQTAADLREALARRRAKPYQQRLADFHLLLWLARQPGLSAGDAVALATAVREDKPPLEGYQVIVDSIAGV